VRQMVLYGLLWSRGHIVSDEELRWNWGAGIGTNEKSE